jgi:Rod binding domain-containing protein
MDLSPINPTAGQAQTEATLDPGAARLQKLRSASVDFEAMLVQQMFQTMQKSLEGGGLVGSGTSGSVYSSILTEAVAKSMAQTQGVGIADQLYADVIRQTPELKKYVEENGISTSLRGPKVTPASGLTSGQDEFKVKDSIELRPLSIPALSASEIPPKADSFIKDLLQKPEFLRKL